MESGGKRWQNEKADTASVQLVSLGYLPDDSLFRPSAGQQNDTAATPLYRTGLRGGSVALYFFGPAAYNKYYLSSLSW